MAVVLASFILAVQEILYLVFFALLFINDQSELNLLVAKNACYIPQGTSHSSEQRALLLSPLFLKIIEFAKFD